MITYRIEERPKNGCARCIWWKQLGHTGWGRCRAHGERTWWQRMPCAEYELDFAIDSAIMLKRELQ